MTKNDKAHVTKAPCQSQVRGDGLVFLQVPLSGKFGLFQVCRAEG